MAASDKNILITPSIGSTNVQPTISFTGLGNSTITLKVLDTNEGSISFEGVKSELLTLTDADVSVGSTVPAFEVRDFYGLPHIQAFQNGNLRLSPLFGTRVGIGTTIIDINYKAQVAGSILVDRIVGTGSFISLGINSAIPQYALDVASAANFSNKLILSSRVNAFSTERMELQTYGIRDGALSINNSGGNQLFNVSNVPDADTEFKINQYNSSGVVTQNTATRNVFSVSVGGTVSSFYPINIGTGLTNNFPSNLISKIVGPLSLVAPHSTASQVVKMVPKYSDGGAISFESPVGTAQTDRGTQIFSISNNLSSTIFRVNDVNRNTILEATSTGNVGIGTTLPLTKLQVAGTTRITSVGATARDEIDIKHYRNIAYPLSGDQPTLNRGALSFDSTIGVTSANGTTFFPASLFAITNDPTGNIFSVGGYRYFSGSPYPVIDVTQNGRLGIGTTTPQQDFHINATTLVTSNVGFGTTVPYVSLDVAHPAQFRSRVAFSQIGDPSVNDTIDFQSINSGITSWAPSGGALVVTENRNNSGAAGGQIYTIENNDETLFRINTVGFGLTTVSTPTTPINQVVDINTSGEIRLFDTETKKIVSSAAGYSSTTPGDSDLFRIDSYVAPFIGSFPTVSKAIRLDKFGLIELSRNVRQIVGNTIIGSATSTGTASQNLQVIGGAYISGNIGIGTTLPRTKLDVEGNLNVTGISTIGLANTSTPITNSTFSFELTNNTTLTVRVRGTDGVVRTGIITLS